MYATMAGYIYRSNSLSVVDYTTRTTPIVEVLARLDIKFSDNHANMG